jgi:hypothetical protein
VDCFKVAHRRENGADLAIVPLTGYFCQKPMREKQKVISYLQHKTTNAGLPHVVVPVWDAGVGKMGFIAPYQWHAFFSRINLRLVAAGLNKEVRC